MATNNQTSRRLLSIAITVAIILLALNAWLLYNKAQQDELIEKQNKELLDADRLTVDLEKQYYEALNDLEDLRTENDEINELIDAQREELKVRKERIEQLIKEKGDLAAARKEIEELRQQIKGYLNTIYNLQEKADSLSLTVDSLSLRSDSLQTRLDSATVINKALEARNMALQKEKEILARKATYASVVKVENVTVTGLKLRNNGKTVRKRYARNVNLLKVCFDVVYNDLVLDDEEYFLIRIINPKGETLAVEQLGSGVFERPDNGDEIRFTFAGKTPHEPNAGEACLTWAPPAGGLSSGNYTVEIYNKGYLAGHGKFKLK
ncbi:MAG: hypothetical protein CMJ42_14865 [Phyllobacteriaceae bacterium]|nr:hypothetical protein [Phyllobacteriaceae bacterium]